MNNWGTVDKAVRQLWENSEASLGYEELYRAVYNIVVAKQDQEFFVKLCELILSLAKVKPFENNCLLSIRDVCMYLEKVKHLELMPVFDYLNTATR